MGNSEFEIIETESPEGEIRISLNSGGDNQQLFGVNDANLKIIRENYKVDLIQRGDELLVLGEEAVQAGKLLEELLAMIASGEKLDGQKVNYAINLAKKGLSYTKSRVNGDILCFTHRGRAIKPKTVGQTLYAKSIKEHDICFGIGPAGTGKTYIAVALAINALKNKEVEKIVLARPAVEAGERLGFLPGDLQEKVDPYLRPLYDALYDMLGREGALRLKEREIIEVVPLAYMRGRTLDSSFIILDEAQNTTGEQMKMFLTRLGFDSKAVITGDITQIDLPGAKQSGLVEAHRILKNVKGIEFCFLKDEDVVRHPLVRRIINAYEYFKNQMEKEEARQAGSGEGAEENR